ncbi:10299_t:CDS:2 [Funneliformis geosporum]|uniref:10299_t:CDS:1 n=1 Tax=Funneliformis geosporum TaxID=1117311 RepID=A0A9W4SGU8_9GLOM|nr:10299_t:CDS:2 [Funneliformis geosporum]
MWCDNCLLIFPIRAGAIALALIMALYQIGGGIFLFKYGDFYFTNIPEASMYGGYAMAQGSLALMAMIGFSSRSFVISRFLLFVYPLIILLGAVRAGVMTWELNHYEDRIIWTCNNGGVKWADANNPNYKAPPALYDNPRLPNGFCKIGVKTLANTFAFSFVIDFILMCYFCFLIWRFNVKLHHYPFQKGEYVYPQ